MTSMAGDSEGIKLIGLMAQSQDELEKEYFNRINQAATKYGQVWFTDTVAQKKTGKNQAIFYMVWEAQDQKWNVSLFMLPEGASKEIADRTEVVEVEDGDWEEIDPELVQAVGDTIA